MSGFSKHLDAALGTRNRGDFKLKELPLDIDPLIKAAGINSDAAAAYVRLDGYYDALFSDAGAAATSEARRLIKEAIRDLEKAAKGQVPGLKDRLNRMRTVLGDGPARSSGKRVPNALKKSASSKHLSTNKVSPELETAWLSAIAGNYGEELRKLFERVGKVLDIRDLRTVTALGDTLQRSVKLSVLKDARRKFKRGGKVDPTSPAFRRFFRRHANALKGKVIERWFYSHPMVKKKLLPELEQQAASGALKLAEKFGDDSLEFVPQVLTNTIRYNGLEMTDGMVVILKREKGSGGKPGKVIEAYIDTMIEIKSEKRLSVLKQFERTMKRMGTGKGKKPLKLDLGEPGLEDVEILGLEIPKKIVVAPRAPTPGQFADSAAAGEGALLETSISADDADDIVFVMLASLVEAL